MRESELRNMNAAALAYMGDAVYEQAVRRRLLESGIRRADRLQKTAAALYVSAAAQAEALDSLFGELEEEEAAMVKRWRNYRPRSLPRNADPMSYKWATAFEAYIGYLYLLDEEERLARFLERVFETIEQGGEKAGK